jgi:hypothetical protein
MSEDSIIIQKLEALSEKMATKDDVHSLKDYLVEKIETIEDNFAEHEKLLRRGNGGPSLVTKQILLENEIAAIKAHCASVHAPANIDQQQITWVWVRDKLMTPIIVAILLIAFEVLTK